MQAELLRAASLAWVLPFMRYVREKEGGRIDIRAARRTTMRQWLDMRDDHERLHAWSLFRNCEAAWNATLAAGNVQVGCGHLTLPEWTADSPLALSCPVVDPKKLRHGDLAIGNYAHPPEHCAAVALHELALNHNKAGFPSAPGWPFKHAEPGLCLRRTSSPVGPGPHPQVPRGGRRLSYQGSCAPSSKMLHTQRTVSASRLAE